MVRLSINYGDDIHHVEIDETTYAAIRDGQKIKLEEDVPVQCGRGREV
jgi:hypothetical protein